jgi:predicted HicB family RNase H-like nuclease
VAKEQAHSRQIIMRVKEEDFEAFFKAATKNKQTLSEWMRETLRNVV